MLAVESTSFVAVLCRAPYARRLSRSRGIKKRASLCFEILENSVELVFLARQCGDRQITAVIGEHHGNAFARLDHALDEHHFARSHAHPPRHEAAEQHLDGFFRTQAGSWILGVEGDELGWTWHLDEA